MLVEDLVVGCLYRPRNPKHNFGKINSDASHAYVDWGAPIGSNLLFYLGKCETEHGIRRLCMIAGKIYTMHPNDWRKIVPVE
jgi:hypothetical protein